MLEDNIKKGILQGCMLDVKMYQKLLNTESNQWSYMVEIMTLTAKSLLPCKDRVGTKIDYKRFEEELKLWKHYRHGYNKSLLNGIDKSSSEIYWKEVDTSIFSRIIPITISNRDYESARDEVIKNILFTTGRFDSLFLGVMYCKIIHMSLEFKRDLEEIKEAIKEEVIGFSQVEFLNQYEDYYRFEKERYDGVYKIDFERAKIKMITSLNGIVTTNSQEKELLESLEADSEIKDKLYIGFLKSILGENKKEDIEVKDSVFLEGLCDYLVKLRKSRISAESIKIQNYNLPDIFSFNEGEVFEHSLLNKSQVIKKEMNSNVIKSIIKTRSGIYRFIKRWSECFIF